MKGSLKKTMKTVNRDSQQLERDLN